MDAVTNLINKIKSRWDGDTTTNTEFDTIKILELMHERMTELDQQVNGKQDYYDKYDNDLLRAVAKGQRNIIQKLLKENEELKKQSSPFLLAGNKLLRSKLARLREQLRWHSMDELPECGIYVRSVNVLLDAHDNYFPVVAYYSYWFKSWINSDTGSNINVKNGDKWCYIPEDNQGTDCTPEGE